MRTADSDAPHLGEQLAGGILAELGLDRHVDNGQRTGESQLRGGAANPGDGRGERRVVRRGERPLLAGRERAGDRELGRGDGLGIDPAGGRERIADQGDAARRGRSGGPWKR